MAPTGFEPAIPASEWPQTHPLDCAATGTGLYYRTSNLGRIEMGRPWCGWELRTRLHCIIRRAWPVTTIVPDEQKISETLGFR